ncbi:Minor histocompatibility antigen H13 [Thelohanellus kitauei]|uniref:Minor histocompatibility antigen H13 n=1 Tax=Thelohanellus kitauei TaxID=669202 RepID=A0A0C2JGH2_THEKT|nr:Minor histocompatibility antigen H13 [Thelohanellus kitauei]
MLNMSFLNKETITLNFWKSVDLGKSILHDAFLKKNEESKSHLEVDPMDKFISSYGMILIAAFVNCIGVYTCAIYKRTTSKDSVLSRDEIMKVPLMLSCSLFGLFCFLKLISVEYLTFAIQVYSLFCGFLSLGAIFGIPLERFWFSSLPPNRCFHFCVSEKDKDLYSVDIKYSDLVAYFVSACIVVGYFVKKSWVLNNIVAASFTFTLLENITLDRFWNSFILFAGLFLYDIFWVYSTNVMVTVAKKIDAPLMFKLPYRTLGPEGTIKYSGLGLGDVAVPGLFLAFLARFDLSLKQKKYNYFGIGMVCYILSLILCTMVVNYTNLGQPAFFYIVPVVFTGVLLMALKRGEMSQLLAFNAECEEEKPKED